MNRLGNAERSVIFGGVGAALGAFAGAIVGLIIGLNVYPPTAWFAAIEVGVPGALAGALLGELCFLVVFGISWSRRWRSDPPPSG